MFQTRPVFVPCQFGVCSGERGSVVWEVDVRGREKHTRSPPIPAIPRRLPKRANNLNHLRPRRPRTKHEPAIAPPRLVNLTHPAPMHKLLPRIPHLRPPLALEKRLRFAPVAALCIVHRVRELVHRRDGEEELLAEDQRRRFRVERRAGRQGAHQPTRLERGVEELRVQRYQGAQALDTAGRREGRVDGGAVPALRLAPGLGAEFGGAVRELEGEQAAEFGEELAEGGVVGGREWGVGAVHFGPVGGVGDGVASTVEDGLPEDLQLGLAEVGGAEGEGRDDGVVFFVRAACEVQPAEDRVDAVEVAEVGGREVDGTAFF